MSYGATYGSRATSPALLASPWLAEEIMWGLLGLPTVGGNTSPIRVGSICSGMMTEQAALSRLPWAFTKAFWCESDAHARRFIIDNIDEPGVPGWDNVMSEEFLTGAPPCDVLLAGFPCQPFSIQGKGEGLEAPASRGIVVTWILRYVKLHSPRIVILENVEGLVFRHRAVLNKVVSVLEQIVSTLKQYLLMILMKKLYKKVKRYIFLILMI